MRQKTFLVFFGPPGSGKGTQADMLGEKISLPVISPGELLRHERDKGTEIGKKIDKLISGGSLVPDKLVEKILDKRLSRKDVKNGFIFDGFPRRESQLEFFRGKFKKIVSKNDIVLAILIDVGDIEVRNRISGRRVCDCGAAYHVKFNPPTKKGLCDLCGEKLYKRQDDDVRVVNKRLKDFHKRIKPLLQYFKKNYKLINIDGEQSIPDVRKELWRKLKL